MVISWASTSFEGGYVSFNDVVDEQMVNSGVFRGGEKKTHPMCFWCQMVLFVLWPFFPSETSSLIYHRLSSNDATICLCKWRHGQTVFEMIGHEITG